MSFEDFIGKLNSDEAEKNRIEVEKPQRKAHYLSGIRQAFDQIEAYLRPHIDSKSIIIMRSVTHSNDIDIGTVDVPMMTVSAGGRGARFTPIGSSGFGINCFIDINPTATGHYAGPRPEAKLIRVVNADGTSDWKFQIPETPVQIPGRPSVHPEMKKYDFSLENLQKILQRMMS